MRYVRCTSNRPDGKIKIHHKNIEYLLHTFDNLSKTKDKVRLETLYEISTYSGITTYVYVVELYTNYQR